ncbi:pyridine nucleotide-disulfide oxidoreductase [Rhizobium vallis]|uniref:Pyridine nucleotide-disulfide oxidoreductase n=1 Tax=Rhizobium vallis TaxID=634290 RepID=A0A3S0SM24_9HYPH|nr:FAD-dependent oxidoreductase [Rhizobium vallis]RUM20461.1 pyridine nucleotide-disulfide oxidoreductase [Rhizobium vallis]
MKRRVLIIGAGQAAVQAAVSLRTEGFDDEIVVLGDEGRLPYQRPPLSKAYLSDGREDILALRPSGFWEKSHISIEPDRPIIAVDRMEREVIDSKDKRLSFTHLIFATGARARTLALPGGDLHGVLSLRTVADATRLRTMLDCHKRIVAIGAGFVGMETAAALAGLGHQVTVVEAGERCLGRAVSGITSETLADGLRQRGVDLRLSAQIERIVGSEGIVFGVQLRDGPIIPADIVLIATGAQPNDQLAAACGLDTTIGICVDSHLRTSDDGIFAIGDCASFDCPREGRNLRLESVQNASDHGRSVALSILGRPVPHDRRPWFWSDQGMCKLQIAGLALPHDDTHTVLSGGKIAAFRFRRERLIAVETVNDPAEHIKARKILAAGPGPTYDDLKAAGFSLGGLA